MKNSPDALVTVSLLPSDEGGRQSPTPETTFGCIMTIGNQNLDVRFRLGGVGPLRPGTTTDVEINFLDPENAKKFVRIGQNFLIREVSVIGHGFVRDIFII